MRGTAASLTVAHALTLANASSAARTLYARFPRLLAMTLPMTTFRRQRPFSFVLLLGLVSVMPLGCGSSSPITGATESADLVFRGGTVYTADVSLSGARAVAVKKGRIVYVGNEQGVEAHVGLATRQIDLKGGMLLPGLHDSHVHIAVGGLNLDQCNLEEDDTVEAVTSHIARCAREHPAAPWVRARGWRLDVFADGSPKAALLDSIVPDRPAFLMSSDGHSAWVNSRALAVVGITAATPDPPGGRIERDPATRQPTGALREGAVFLVARQMPPTTASEWEAGIRKGIELANSFGITSLMEANADDALIAAYAALASRGELNAKVAVSARTDLRADVGGEVARMNALRQRHRSGRLRVVAAKLTADGALESRTAALLAPYARSRDRGPTEPTPERFTEFVTAFDKSGCQVHVHAIGDRAVRMSLDAIAAAQAKNGVRDARHQIAHLELVDPADVPRFRALSVIANAQPLWAYRDEDVELTEPMLGPERSRRLYPLGSLARAGAMLVAGSDWSVSSMNPFAAIQVAITRRDPEDPASAPWLPDERLSLDTTLQAYTINAARSMFHEQDTGSIAIGKAADLVVLDRDLLTSKPEDIHLARVVSTFIDGSEVYRAPRQSSGTPTPTR
jgi:predicted amidohydrolase YtcJ